MAKFKEVNACPPPEARGRKKFGTKDFEIMLGKEGEKTAKS